MLHLWLIPLMIAQLPYTSTPNFAHSSKVLKAESAGDLNQILLSSVINCNFHKNLPPKTPPASIFQENGQMKLMVTTKRFGSPGLYNCQVVHTPTQNPQSITGAQKALPISTSKESTDIISIYCPFNKGSQKRILSLIGPWSPEQRMEVQNGKIHWKPYLKAQGFIGARRWQKTKNITTKTPAQAQCELAVPEEFTQPISPDPDLGPIEESTT